MPRFNKFEGSLQAQAADNAPISSIGSSDKSKQCKPWTSSAKVFGQELKYPGKNWRHPDKSWEWESMNESVHPPPKSMQASTAESLDV
jgi:hypothetical protein